MKKTLLCAIGALGALSSGCAHHPAPTDEVAKSLAAVRGAGEAGAKDVPEAALHLKLAQEQIEQAQQLMKDDQNQRAEDKAARAGQDAELALLLARRNTSQQKLDSFARANNTAGGEAPTVAPANGATP